MTEKNQAVVDSLEMLLDKNLADVEDLPEYLDNVPNGFYKLLIVDIERKSVEVSKEKGSTDKVDAPVIQFIFEILECVELEDKTKEAPKEKARFNESFFLHNKPELTIASIKAKYKDIATSLNIDNMLALINVLKGMSIGAKVKTVTDKNKEGTYYIRVSNAQVL